MNYILFNLIISILIVFVSGFIFSRFTNSSEWIGLSNYDNKDNFFDLIYFSSTTLSTTGYGEIRPISKRTKTLVIILQFISLLSIINLSKYILINNNFYS